MKKFICLVLIVCIFALSGCGFETAPVSDKSRPLTNVLSEKGIELIGKVDKLAECEEFTDLYTANEEIANVIKGIADNDYANPQGIFIIEDLDALVLESIMPEATLPDDIAQMLKGRLAATLPSQITAMNGATSIAAISILSYEESFICEGLENPVAYLYTYGSDYSFMVNYNSNNENIVNAKVTVVINENLSKCTSQEEVSAFFGDALNYNDVSISVATEER